MVHSSNLKNLRIPKRIPVKFYWDNKQKRLIAYNSKGEDIKVIYCDSSLSLCYNNQIFDGRIEMSHSTYSESHGYYFLYGDKELVFPLTDNYDYYTWVDEYNVAITMYDQLESVIDIYGKKSFL